LAHKSFRKWNAPTVADDVQRKVSGTALLGARLKAKVNIRRITEDVLASTNPIPAAVA